MAAQTDFTKFVPLGSTQQSKRVNSQAMMTLSKNAMFFNAQFVRCYPQFKKLTIAYHDNQLLLSFYQEGNPGAMTISHDIGSAARVGFLATAKQLAKRTDVVNLEVFNYKYKISMLEDGHHAIVDLNDPYGKNKRRKQNNGN